EHHLTVRRGGEGVVARPVALGGRVGDEHRGPALGPGRGVQQVGVGIGGQHAHGVVDAGGRGGVGQMDLSVTNQHGRALVDPEAADLPVVLGAAELDRLGGQGPGVVHPGDVEVGMALDVEMLLDHTRYCWPWWTTLVASSAKDSQPVSIWPRSIHSPSKGSAAVFSSTNMRWLKVSSVPGTSTVASSFGAAAE